MNLSCFFFCVAGSKQSIKDPENLTESVREALRRKQKLDDGAAPEVVKEDVAPTPKATKKDDVVVDDASTPKATKKEEKVAEKGVETEKQREKI